MQTNFETFISALLGVAIMLLFNLNKARKKIDFSYHQFVKNEWFTTVMNIAVVFSLMYIFDEGQLAQIVMPNKVTAFMYGLNSQYMIRQIGLFIDGKVDPKDLQNDLLNSSKGTEHRKHIDFDMNQDHSEYTEHPNIDYTNNTEDP